MGLKHELRGCEWDKGVGTPSPSCAHTSGQPSPPPAQHCGSQQMLEAANSLLPSKPVPRGGHGAPGRFCCPCLPWAAPGLGCGSKRLPFVTLPGAGTRGSSTGSNRSKARAGSCPPPGAENRGGFASLEDEEGLMLPPKITRQQLEPQRTHLGQSRELPLPTRQPSHGSLLPGMYRDICNGDILGYPSWCVLVGSTSSNIPPVSPRAAAPWGGLGRSGSRPGLHLNEKPQPWLGGFCFLGSGNRQEMKTRPRS